MSRGYAYRNNVKPERTTLPDYKTKVALLALHEDAPVLELALKYVLTNAHNR